MTWRGTGFGLSIESACAVPGLVPAAAPENPDLRIEMLPGLPQGEGDQPLYQREGDTLIFSAAGVAQYRIRRDWIGIAPSPDADPERVTGLLVATALPALVWMRGDAVLHAAGLRTPSGQGVLLAGPSGIGKSTVAVQFLERGAALAADDSVRLEQQDHRLIVNGLAGGFHRVTDEGDRRDFCAVPREKTVRDLPIGAILVLAQGEGDAALVRLSSLEALTALLANQHRPNVPAILERREQMLAVLGFVAQRCPVYAWRRSSPMLAATEWEILGREGIW